MKTFATILFSLALISCGQKTKEGENTKIEGAKPPMEKTADSKIDVAILASKIDPVCDMDVSGGVADTATYKGKVYGFCGTGCKEEFVKNPEEALK